MDSIREIKKGDKYINLTQFIVTGKVLEVPIKVIDKQKKVIKKTEQVVEKPKSSLGKRPNS